MYLTTLNPFDLHLLLGLALLALLLRWFDFPLAPLLLGFILSGLFEENVRRSLLIAESGGSRERPAVVPIGPHAGGRWLLPLGNVCGARCGAGSNYREID